MTLKPTLFDLQASVQDRSAFIQLDDYYTLSSAFLNLLAETQPTRIISPNDPRYIFYQYGELHSHKITRPLNSHLFIETVEEFQIAFERFVSFLSDLRRLGQAVISTTAVQTYLKTNEINKIVYTCQQIVGSIGDSFTNPNQSRKRIGQLFENMVKLIINEIGFKCESRTILVPIPGYPDHKMSYELDLVFSKRGAIVASES